MLPTSWPTQRSARKRALEVRDRLQTLWAGAPPDTRGARALGWISLGIGLVELAAPKQIQALLGLEDTPAHRGILRVLGVREVLHGVGILTAPDPTPTSGIAPMALRRWNAVTGGSGKSIIGKSANGKLAAGIWSRVAGDLLDNALLGVAATKTKRPGSFAGVVATVSAIGLADLYHAVQLSRQNHRRTS